MRSGACAVQQTLTAEAASVLKHSLSLARRRGHGQVTPLHVAATLLSSRTSLLRRACLKSQPQYQTSHPLHCRALELCFNVALNRLPTTPGPLFHGQPSLSNALIAALKRAQAHQRRGCIEQQQQQPLLTIKVELEQLIISILDDPSVSRVMREAGFSSTVIKNNIEEDSSASSVFYTSSGGVYSSPCSPTDQNPANFWQTHFLTYSSEQNPVLFSPQKRVFINPSRDSSVSVKEDIKLVFEVLLRKKKRNTVIVGDSVSITESLVAEVIGRIERGEVPEELKSTHFIKFQFAPLSLRFMKKEEVETNLTALKRKVDSVVSGERGVIIYIGDLIWTIEERERGLISISNSGEYSCGYSPVGHMVSEIAKLVSDSDFGSFKPKVWLLATASYQTYMRCQMRQPPLEIQWNLQAVSVPSAGLGLSLQASSVHDSRIMFSQNSSQVLETKPFVTKDEQDHYKLSFCSECASNYEKEVQLLKSGHQKLPAWLQSHGTESHQKDELVDLKKKWNKLCLCLHQGRNCHQSPITSSLWNNNQSLGGKSYSHTSTYPKWSIPESNSISFADSASKLAQSSNLVPRFRRQQSCTIEFNIGGGVHKHKGFEPSLDSLKSSEESEDRGENITLALGSSVFSGRTMERVEICKVLKDNVPWQSETIASIVEAIFDSKSMNQDTWLLIEGNDSIGKRRLALAIAESIIGSADLLLHLNMNKRNDFFNPPSEILAKALKNHERVVVLVEDIDSADAQFIKFLADGFEIGKFGDVVRKQAADKGQAIFILTKGDTTIKNKDCAIQMRLKITETTTSSSVFKFDHKRKADWEMPYLSKNPRTEDENLSKNKDFSRQSSFNTLDLNIKVNEDNESEEKLGEFSPVSSDLTRETTTDRRNPNGFLESIENKFVFNRSPARDREMTEVFLSKMEQCYGEVYGKQNVNSFRVEENVLEEVGFGCGYFVNSLFENWLKGVFKTSLETVKFGGKDGILVRLCLGGIESDLEDGFMGSCLPKKIQVSLKD